jgi:hypothetical protein
MAIQPTPLFLAPAPAEAAEELPTMTLADVVPLTATQAARDVLGDYNAYASFVAHGHPVRDAAKWTGAPIDVHAARLAAELANVLADNAMLRVLAAGAVQ